MAYFSITNIKETTAYINVSGLDKPFNSNHYVYIGVTDYRFPESDKTVPPDYTMGEVDPEDDSENNYVGFQVRGLDAGETYTFYCFAQAINGNYYPIYNSSSETGLGITFTTDDESSESIDIEKWSWTSSNGSATATQTKKAYTAITSNGKLTDFSYLVWNDMVDKVFEIKELLDENWSTKNANTGATYLSYSKTKMTSSDRTMTAKRFNSLKFQIGDAVGTNLDDVDTGDKILGRYFTLLTDRMNVWIDRIS